jgi:hypothetical protein
MGQGRLEVGNPCQEDRIVTVVVIRLEDQLVPVVRLRAIVQQPVQSLSVVASARQRPAEKRQPVVLAPGGRVPPSPVLALLLLGALVLLSGAAAVPFIYTLF